LPVGGVEEAGNGEHGNSGSSEEAEELASQRLWLPLGPGARAQSGMDGVQLGPPPRRDRGAFLPAASC
jgi:hypothetical protein